MLSICIPVYNYDVRRLVEDLHFQAGKTDFAFEILLIDDASDENFRDINKSVDLESVRYIQLDKNIGRSKIRNLLSEEARFHNLLFMDCDSAVATSEYIEKYIPFFDSRKVCCGGRIYEEKRPDDSTYLRWKYGKDRECVSASERRKKPNSGFQTNNFLIHKSIFEKVKFDESLDGYGHEDTLFGLELAGNGIIIEHIDNPLIHIGLENAADFLEKTEKGIKNLHRVELILREKYPECIDHSGLMKSKLFLRKFHLSGFASTLFRVFRNMMKNNLLGGKPSLLIFDFYRLGLFR